MNHNARVLGKEHLHNVVVVLHYVVQVDMHATFSIGKSHLKKSRDKATSGNVMASHDPTFLYKVLNGVETVGEILAVLYSRNVGAYLAQCLCESRTAKTLLIEREVNVI